MTQTIPKTMRAIALDRFGGPETLKLQTIPVPEIAPDEVLLHVEIAGVGAWDPSEREGEFAEMVGEPEFPYVLGSEGAGTIAAVGKNVDRFKEGDRVYAAGFLNPKGGFYAEYAAVNADTVSPISGHLTTQQAGVFLGDGVTALRGLDDTLHLQSGESLMIFGASGGIGHIAVQLAKRMGVRVLAVASGDDGVTLMKGLGADMVINGRKDDIQTAVGEFAPRGLDTALVTVGGEAANNALQSVREGGRVAYPNGVMPEPKVPSGVQMSAYDGSTDREIIERLNRLIEAGPFEVCVDRVFSLEQAAEAQNALSEHHLGKLALKVG